MRKLLLLSFLTILFACSDGSLLQPVNELSIASGQSEVAMQASGEMIPFKASGTWWGASDATAEEIATCAAAGGTVDVGVGIINVTHLGRSHYRTQNCWGPEEILYQNGWVIAANGDKLYFHGPGPGGWQVYEVDWSVYPFTWKYAPLRFTGGTGRFEGATGSFVAFGDAYFEEPAGWYGTEFWEGMISSVGSNK